MANNDSDNDSCIQAQTTLIAQQNPEAETHIHAACSECKRRKQKCTRHWPCQHCGDRRQADQCVFQTVLEVKPPEQRKAQTQHLVTQMKDLDFFSYAFLETFDDDSGSSDADLEELGYSASHVASTYSGHRKKRRRTTRDSERPVYYPHLEKAVKTLPSRSCLDALVDNFLNHVNFHYYVVHPTVFRREYERWCHRADNDDDIELQWTALLLMACACSAQYPSDALRHALEADQDQPIDQLAEQYHAVGHDLSTMIPITEYDMHTVQSFLHSSLWFKTKACYSESWHNLTTAMRVASELDIHNEEFAHPASQYQLEMGRRAWAIICAWDWQLGSIISRPLLLQPNVYDTRLPGLALKGELEEPEPSPGQFMSLQCELGSALLGPFGRPGPLEEMNDVAKHRDIVEAWAVRLPSYFSLRDPDTSLDDDFPWLRFQRLNLAFMGTSSLLSPLRSYLTKPLSTDSAAEDLQLQQDGVLWALRHLNMLFQVLRFTFPKDTTYRTVLFFIFDVTVLLCSAVVHDIDSSMPMRGLALRAIDDSISMMRALKRHAPIATQSYKVLDRICDEYLRLRTTDDAGRSKRQKLNLWQNQVFPNRRVENMPELDEYWDGYDFSFSLPSMSDSPESLGSSVTTLSPSDDDDDDIGIDEENAEIAYTLFTSIASSRLDDQCTADTSPDI
ncbi:hypothetical protein V8C42DRAFT_304267 [Trichoderma barbatum]